MVQSLCNTVPILKVQEGRPPSDRDQVSRPEALEKCAAKLIASGCQLSESLKRINTSPGDVVLPISWL